MQHKTPNNERAAKSEPVDVIGMSQNNPIDQAVQELSTSPDQKALNMENTQASHAFKPAASVPHKPMHTINQPRK